MTKSIYLGTITHSQLASLLTLIGSRLTPAPTARRTEQDQEEPLRGILPLEKILLLNLLCLLLLIHGYNLKNFN